MPLPHPNQSFSVEVHNMEMHAQEEKRGRGDNKTDTSMPGLARPDKQCCLIRHFLQRSLFTKPI